MRLLNKTGIVLVICSVMLSFSVNAAKIYKWIDADGNVHFSSTPGPDQDAGSHIGETSRQSTRPAFSAKALASQLKGTWHGSLRGNSYKLTFRGNSIRWYLTNDRPNAVNSLVLIFDAIWKDKEGDLYVTYSNYPDKPRKNGQSDTIRIISKSDETLTLQFPDKHVYNLTRETRYRKVGVEGKNLIGSWVRTSDEAEVRFKSGTFVIKNNVENRVGKVITEQGNWRVSDGTLELTYTRGVHTAGKQGKTDKFSILLNDESQLILEDPKTRKQVVYNRKLSK